MITHDLYNPVLISPCEEGADELRIISGYATSAMASRHLEDLKKINPETKVSLLVGMCPTDGVSLGNHKGFQSLISKNFMCSYVKEPPPVHGKLYLWYKRNEIVKSFIGSANYTNNAFSSSQREVLTEFNDYGLSNYYSEIEKDSVYCNSSEVENLVCIHNDKNYYRQHPMKKRYRNPIHLTSLGYRGR